MSLLDDLKAAAHAIDPQFQITSNEVTGVTTALAAYVEHGDEFLKAAESGVEDVTKLLAPAPPEPAPEPAPAATVEDLQKQVSDLEAQLASRQATEQQTTVTHETGPGPTEGAAA